MYGQLVGINCVLEYRCRKFHDLRDLMHVVPTVVGDIRQYAKIRV